jgi:serine/threonine protein kinase
VTEEKVFLAALDLPDAAARAAYLDGVCGTDGTFRRQVEALLASHFRSGEFLHVPAAEQIKAGSADSKTISIQGDAVSAEKNSDEESDGLQFLTPSTRPDSLGRLGHYEVLQVLGKGGFGIVFRAFDDVLQRVVALKVMAPQLAATSPARKRFLREARTSAAVRHENVVQVYEVGEQPLPFLVMEFIPGETLQQRLDRVGPLDVSETLRVGRQIAEGLAAAHATDCIHRDIKPGNILLEGGQHKVKITDFGLARAADDASISQSGIIAGTPMYMAPEQAKGESLDQRADLFSLGSVLYQMAAGRPPFRANGTVTVLKRVAEDTPRAIREIIPETPQWLCDIIAKLHAKNPDDRYQSARDVADVLADCEAQLKDNSKLKDFSRIPRGKSVSPRKWKWVAAAAVVLLTLVALGALEYERVSRLFQGQQATHDATPIQVATNADGFVSLFNGQDLTGWKTHPDQPGDWKVEGGAIVGRTIPSYLYSDRTFDNFHLRVEAIINRGGDSGIYFRAPFSTRQGRTADQLRPAGGYEVELQENPGYAIRTGSVWDAETNGPPRLLWKTNQDSLTADDEWFTLELIARGNHITTKVNGTRTADCEDSLAKYAAGHLALQVFNSRTVVQFRKIEIKELPASPPEPDGFVQLFNGKDLTGWKTHPDQPGDWTVEGGVLIGRGPTASHLFSDRGDFADFELRVEARINAGGDSGLFFRSEFGAGRYVPQFKKAVPRAYEAQICVVESPAWKTGSLIGSDESDVSTALEPVLTNVVRPDDWFTMVATAQGNRIQVRVDGKLLVNYTDAAGRYARGHIALQVFDASTVVQFRKIEIKELPAVAPPPRPPTAP